LNYLAHAFLSGSDSELLLGNFIADSVKGKQINLYTSEVAKGIKLHRMIDTYTDTHPIVGQSKARLRPKYRKFAPVIADMFYDHFLAKNFNAYSKESLLPYTLRIYTIIQESFDILPDKMQYIFPYMRQHNWLLGYAEIDGINQALTGMSRRASFESGMETATIELQENYALYAAEFEEFFPDLIQYVEQVRNEM
jgi:acyl carrier protein phosphodiesterase